MNSTTRPGWTARLVLLPLITIGMTGLLARSNREAVAAAPPGPRKVEFNRDIRPILSENCNRCHGPDKNKRKAELRLDQRVSAVSTKAIVPGKPDESELIARIQSTDTDEVMPPPSSHKALTPVQKKLLEQWIAEGAEYQSHWAYVSPHRPAPPAVKQSAWVQNPVDAFILAGLEAKGIKPSPEADRPTLIRRLSLDVIGLPPTPEEIHDFVADTRPDAYERLVDRLLRSPHYGERMAVAWLDLVRFSDTVGYHGDQNQRIFPYRDYVIDAFNANKPFDQFTLEQIAGDLLPNATPEQRVATGFNRLNMMTREGGAQPGEYLAKYAGDRVRTVGITWLGTTLGCCECHDHKYDPFTMRDFTRCRRSSPMSSNGASTRTMTIRRTPTSRAGATTTRSRRRSRSGALTFCVGSSSCEGASGRLPSDRLRAIRPGVRPSTAGSSKAPGLSSPPPAAGERLRQRSKQGPAAARRFSLTAACSFLDRQGNRATPGRSG